jgi:SpoVK/Ycf46/Vps4 family AAA+-type ATPase
MAKIKILVFENYNDFKASFKETCQDSEEELVKKFHKLNFPFKTEDIDSIDQILTLINFLKDNKLETVHSKYLKLINCTYRMSQINSMIGLKDAKTNLASQILSLCDRSENDSSRINSVIYGPPGSGKSTLAMMLAELYLEVGAVKTKKVIIGDRSNMIGEFVGETAIKTKKLLASALNGVLFIDEAYQLGHAPDGNRCPFAYECIVTLTQFITDNPGKLVVILAGYEKDIKANFFAQNEGLQRRFPFQYKIEAYSSKELMEIFIKQAKDLNYIISDNALDEEIFKDKKLFEYYGGDTEQFFTCCRMIHEKRMFSCLKEDNVLSKTDVEKGLIMFKKSKNKTKEKEHWQNMYN